MEPRCIQTPIHSSDRRATDDSRVANWICIPYFRLQQYAESPAASNTALFPTQTLLQAQYSRSSQQRDMDQAVCQLGQVPRGYCFHISQLWCLIVGNSRYPSKPLHLNPFANITPASLSLVVRCHNRTCKEQR